MKTVDSLLAEMVAFDGMDPEHVALIAGCGRNRTFKAGERLMREGDRADTFYVIRRGAVALETRVPQRGSLTIETIHEGDLLNWSWLVPPYRSAFDARAVGVVRTLAFDGACLRGKAEADSALGYALLKRFLPVVVERLQATRLRLLDIYGHELAG